MKNNYLMILVTLFTCVSTAKYGLLYKVDKTKFAVFLPTPCNLMSSFN